MAIYSSWIHGNALTVETPANLATVGHRGWGGEMLIKPGKGSWFHIPLPTPTIVAGVKSVLTTVYLMFVCEDGAQIEQVAVYDTNSLIQHYPNLKLKGDHVNGGKDSSNTFKLASTHNVFCATSISFYCREPGVGIDSPIPPGRLLVSAAGADYLIA